MPAASLRCNEAIKTYWRQTEVNTSCAGGQTDDYPGQPVWWYWALAGVWPQLWPQYDANLMWLGNYFLSFCFKHKTLNLNQGYRHQANIVSSGCSQQLQQNYLNILVSFRGEEETHFRSALCTLQLIQNVCETDYSTLGRAGVAREIIWYFMFCLSVCLSLSLLWQDRTDNTALSRNAEILNIL